MSKFVKVQNGNYHVSVPKGNKIWLDVGNEPNPGTVVITGNLEVQGVQTTVNTQVLDIEDNIISLNVSNLSVGYQSGLEIRRPDENPANNAYFLLDQSQTHFYNNANQTKTGIWTFVDAADNLMGIQTASINAGGQTLYLDINSTTGYVTVSRVNGATGDITKPGGSLTSYSRRVWDWTQVDATIGGLLVNDPNAVTTTQAVIDYVDTAFQYKSSANITDGDTSVTVADLTTTGNPSVITFRVDGNTKATMDGSGTTIDSIKIFANNIASLNSNNLVLSSITTAIEANGWMLFDNQITVPTAVSGGTYLYANATIGAGKTGLYIVNTTVSDELVSKNRALLFSMIF